MSKKYDQLENFSNASAIQYKYLTRKNEHKKESSPITKFQIHFINSIQIGVVELKNFQTGGTKSEKFLPKNQHTQNKFWNFENWTNKEPQQLAKIRIFKVDHPILPLFLVPKLRSVAQTEWKKQPFIFFLLLVQK